MDIDIDFPTDFEAKTIFNDIVLASRLHKNSDGEIQLLKHPAGVYFQNIPVDSVTGLAAVPFNQCEDLGFFKIDCLHLSLLENFTSKEQIRRLSKIDPDWDLLQDRSVVEDLFQIHKYYELVQRVKPRSVLQLADCIALIRPSKRTFLNKYIEMNTEEKIEFGTILYGKPEDGKYYFKKSHSIAYAVTIAIQLHLIKDGKINDTSS